MLNYVDVLFTGFSQEDETDPLTMRANCTCTLIRTRSGSNIIVDTMTAWDGNKLQEALQQRNLQPKDISVVVCTHGHSDHIGSNYLIQQAQYHIVGAYVSRKEVYPKCFENGLFELEGKDVVVQRTPGHTLSCVSVLINNTDKGDLVGVCGDLFEREADITDESIWLNAGSEDVQKQRQERLRIAEMCTFIIPGHGPGFNVTKEVIQKLREDLNKKHF